MEWQQMMDRLKSPGIVPVIRIEEEAQAAPLAKALCRGGLPLAEVTFRTKAAAGAIARMREACPEMLLGAGTVLTRSRRQARSKRGHRLSCRRGSIRRLSSGVRAVVSR